MKNRSFISIMTILLAFSFLATSCEDMLSPDLKRYTEDYAKDSIYSAFGILKSIQNVGERSILLDAARSDLATTGTYTTDSIKSLADFDNPEDGSSTLLNVASYYHIINSCNFYMARVDTMISKNGVPEMKREYAQIQSLRGWAYIQLVRFYGSVPFITEPVTSTAEAREFEQSAPKVNKKNLIDHLIEKGLLRALELQKQYGMPSNYGSLNNGNVTTSASACFVPLQLVFGDAYLMKNDYENAAYYYYDYLYYISNDDNNEIYSCGYSTYMNNGIVTNYFTSAQSWLKGIRDFNSSEQPVITIGAANTTFGTMITGIAQNFGFKTSVSQSTSTGVDADGNTVVTTTAGVSTTPNEQYQQILPSKNYISLNENQKFCMWSDRDNLIKIDYISESGDGRLYGTAPQYRFSSGGEFTRIIDKFAPARSNRSLSSSSSSYLGSGDFRMLYRIPLYRKPQILMRFAEAINRLGFPQIAFGVLKDGLISENFPTFDYHDIDSNVYYVNADKDTLGIIVDKVLADTTVADTLLYADGYKADSTKMQFHVPYFSNVPKAYTGGMYYLTVDEMERAQKYKFLDFQSSSVWSQTAATNYSYAGIHSRGCGNTGGTQDTIYTYSKMVAKKIAENYARQNSLSYEAQVAYEKTLHKGDTLLVTDQNLIVNAVEDLIVDESALETAFEGHRFTDLIRIADHKNNAGFDGTNWFAWKVARRNYSVTTDANQYDASLFSKMQDNNKIYLQLPTSK